MSALALLAAAATCFLPQPPHGSGGDHLSHWMTSPMQLPWRPWRKKTCKPHDARWYLIKTRTAESYLSRRGSKESEVHRLELNALPAKPPIPHRHAAPPPQKQSDLPPAACEAALSQREEHSGRGRGRGQTDFRSKQWGRQRERHC